MIRERLLKVTQDLQYKRELLDLEIQVLEERLAQWYPDEWELVKDAYGVIALFLSTEITRLKHDTANFMLGFDYEPPYGKVEELDLIKETIRLLPDYLDQLSRAAEKKDQEGLDKATELVAEAIGTIQDCSKSLQEATYGE